VRECNDILDVDALKIYKHIYEELRGYESFTWVVHEVFITHESFCSGEKDEE
jgi:hypothetical protein